MSDVRREKHHVHLSHAFTTLGATRHAYESAARSGAVRADQHHDPHSAAHRRGCLRPSRRRQRAGLPPHHRRPDRAAGRLPHWPGPPPHAGPVRGDPRSAPSRTRRTETAGPPGPQSGAGFVGGRGDASISVVQVCRMRDAQAAAGARRMMRRVPADRAGLGVLGRPLSPSTRGLRW